jgi:tetratricopeptide (TPR) repeat protein
VNGSARTDFFVSYTQADRAWAEWIGWQLEQAGYTVILQAWDFLPGTDWVHQMDTALQRAERMLAVLSPAYLESSAFGEAEWRVAFAADPSGEGRRLIPVRVLECHPEGLLKTRVYVDLAGRGEQDAAAALLRGVSEHTGRPGSKPVFPGVRAAVTADRPRFPGALPAVFTVPFAPSPWFTGRAEMLAAIRGRLADTGSGRVVPVTGIGGVGKTQLAAEYAYAERTSYDVIWWVRAQPLAMARADLAAIVADPRLPDPPQLSAQASAEDRLAAARDWLERHDRCLLIVDNVDDPAAVRPLLPRAGGGHVLLTARSDVDWSGWATPLPLDMLEPGDASRFLRDRSGDPDEPAADALADELGRLPLALEQAAGYIAETGGLTLAGYLTQFRTRSRELLGRGRPAGRDDTVNTTWSLSLDRLTETSPSAVDLLTVAAFLAADDIPIPLLTEHVAELPDRLAGTVTDPLALADTIGILRRYGLAKAAADAITVHRLLQTVVRNGLDDDVIRQCAGAAVELVASAFPSSKEELADPNQWPRCTQLLPHALVTVEHASQARVAEATAAILLMHAGSYLERTGDYTAARRLLEQSKTMIEAARGPDHIEVAWVLNALGYLLQDQGDQGDLAAARSAHKRALAIEEACLPPGHPDIGSTLNNLGHVLCLQGDLRGAHRYLKRALKISTAAPGVGRDHPEVASTLNNLGQVLRLEGNLAGARKDHQRALEIKEAAPGFGPDHPDVGRTLNYLGAVLQDLGELAAAKNAYQRALDIFVDKAGFPPNHPDVTTSCEHLTMVLRALEEQPDGADEPPRDAPA